MAQKAKLEFKENEEYGSKYIKNIMWKCNSKGSFELSSFFWVHKAEYKWGNGSAYVASNDYGDCVT